MGFRVLHANDAYWRPSNMMGVLNTDLAKQLEERVESQGRKEREYEAQAKAIIKAPPAYKAAASAFRDASASRRW